MCYKDSEKYRNIEIRTMFFTVLRMKLSGGMTYREAKEEAFCAIKLRYHLSYSRSRIIIAENARVKSNMPLFMSRNEELIHLMKEIDAHYQLQIEQFSNFIYSSNALVSEISQKMLNDYKTQCREITDFISLIESINVEYKKHR